MFISLVNSLATITQTMPIHTTWLNSPYDQSYNPKKSSLTSFSALSFWIVKAIQLVWDFVKIWVLKKIEHYFIFV
jgi:hypothetical protein